MNTFPESMKNAVIIPIHKKENPDEISNYRPISILPTLSKIFERSAVDQLVEYLEKNNLLSKNQHAYRKQHSTVTCLMEVINHVYNLLENKKYTAIASLDLSKAFDSINQSFTSETIKIRIEKRSSTIYQILPIKQKAGNKIPELYIQKRICSIGHSTRKYYGTTSLLMFYK